jgi:hypothetical protein
MSVNSCGNLEKNLLMTNHYPIKEYTSSKLIILEPLLPIIRFSPQMHNSYNKNLI